MRFPAPHLNPERCGHYRCSADWSWDSGPLADFDLWLVASGRGQLYGSEGAIHLQAHHCYLLRRGQSYRGRQDPHQRLVVTALHFDYRDVRQQVVTHIPDLPPLACRLPDPDLTWALARRILGCLPDHLDQANAYFAALHAEIRQAARLKQTGAGAGRITALCEAIRADPAHDWRVEMLARRCGWDRSHFARRFRRQTGCSPQAFIIQTRLAAARQMLSRSNLAIGRIAEELGYVDIHHFCTQFRRCTGQTPGQWRADNGAG